MGRELAARHPAAAAVFAAADAALGEPLSELAFEGPAEQLDLTVNAQPALLATSIAYLRAFEATLAAADRPSLWPAFMAGHSMGQYSALVAAGVLDLSDAVRLVRERGRLMQASGGEGAMAAILGLDEARLPEVLAAGAALGEVGLANRNAPGQVVISGLRAAVEAAAEAARGASARRAIVLPVSVAAHSPLMAQAAQGMRAAVAAVTFHDPGPPLLANADGRLLTTAGACRTELIDHLTTGVDWIASVEAMTAAGVTTFLEVGPGRVLTGLGKRIAAEATWIPLDDPANPQGLPPPDAVASQAFAGHAGHSGRPGATDDVQIA